MALLSFTGTYGSFELVALAVGCIILSALVSLRSRAAPKLDLPIVGDPNATDCRAALEEGSKRYPDTPWVLPLQDPIVILPTWAAGEIKNLPESQLSLNKELYIRFLGRYTLMGQDDKEMVAVIKHDLTRSLSSVFDTILLDEAPHALRTTIGPCPAWTPVGIFEQMARAVTMINGRAFVGLPLSRDPAWIASTIAFTTEGDVVAQALRPFPALLRPLVAPLHPAVRSLRRHQAIVAQKTQPLVHAHLAARGDAAKESSGKLLAWLLGRYARRPSLADVTRDYLLSSAASIPIPATLLVHVLFELAARPEYVEPLRAELAAAVAANAGRFGHSCLARLGKMDSFVRECQRLNSHGLVMMTRRTVAPLTLSNGATVPAGVSVGISNHNINRSPERYPQPDEFRGFRFDELRRGASSSDDQQAEEEEENEQKSARQHQFASTGPDNLNWGYGIHACPGRYFAAAAVKLVVALVLSNYDVKLDDAEGRPPNLVFGVLVMPNPAGKLLLKSRKPIPGLEL